MGPIRVGPVVSDGSVFRRSEVRDTAGCGSGVFAPNRMADGRFPINSRPDLEIGRANSFWLIILPVV